MSKNRETKSLEKFNGSLADSAEWPMLTCLRKGASLMMMR